MPARNCQIVVEAFAVLCPYCGDVQPAEQSGSEMWTPDDLKGDPKRRCVSCDETITIDMTPKTARFERGVK